jgi:hypothetical protein
MMTMFSFTSIALSLLASISSNPGESWQAAEAPADLAFTSGTFEGWTVEGEGTWSIEENPELFCTQGEPTRFVVDSQRKGEAHTGRLRSKPFRIEHELQRFSISGWDGTRNANNDGQSNFVHLRSSPDGEILRSAHVPGRNWLTPVEWHTMDLIGREVFIEVVDDNTAIRNGGFAWIAFADYRQEPSPYLKDPVDREDLFAVRLDAEAKWTTCRTIPFHAAAPGARGETRRIVAGLTETIPVDSPAEVVYLLGMINQGWDRGVSHWGEHPELRTVRDDQIHVGVRIGELEIRYESGASDRIPLVVGATVWFVEQWAHGPTHNISRSVREPFASRPELDAILRRSLHLRENGEFAEGHTHWFLAIEPRQEKIESILVHDEPTKRGRPLVSAVTLAGATPSEGLEARGPWRADATDLAPALRAEDPGDWSDDLEALAGVLYADEDDLPTEVELLEFPESLKAARIRFIGGVEGDMLSNLWVANLTQIADKFPSEDGFFHETGKATPWYGGYSGIGTWIPIGVYHRSAFSRSADHFATLALRCIDDPVRNENFVDFVDRYFYYYRHDHDPEHGPPNAGLAVERYPDGAPGHWAFCIPPGGPPWQINEIPGDEETDGHGATAVARWLAWRTLGAPKGAWLTEPREEIYGHSRWDTTREAAEFICWLMDYTGMDVIWCEGESTGWGGKAPWGMRLTDVEDWPGETDPEKLRRNYANANMYEPYPSWTCRTALLCSADIADALGEAKEAERWRAYAARLEAGMVRLLAVGEHGSMTWKESRFSVFPSLQDSLVQAWFSIYRDGLDPQRFDPELTRITLNTLRRQLDRPYGHAPVLGMGYGAGWLTKSALILDYMDDAGPLLTNIAKYSYDPNMDWADEERGLDWRPHLWLIPEGTNILPDGSWYRIGDLTNGANQGPAMHALELCAGIDDTDPHALKILPRAPAPLTGLEVQDFLVLVPEGEGLARARVSYEFTRPGTFTLRSDRFLPTLAVRLGPFEESEARRVALEGKRPVNSTVRLSASGNANGRVAWWVWVEGMRDVSEVELDLTK